MYVTRRLGEALPRVNACGHHARSAVRCTRSGHPQTASATERGAKSTTGGREASDRIARTPTTAVVVDFNGRGVKTMIITEQPTE